MYCVLHSPTAEIFDRKTGDHQRLARFFCASPDPVLHLLTQDHLHLEALRVKVCSVELVSSSGRRRGRIHGNSVAGVHGKIVGWKRRWGLGLLIPLFLILRGSYIEITISPVLTA